MPWIFASILIICNVLDTVFTLLLVSTKQATESNWLMAKLLDYSPLLFFYTKLVFVTACAVILAINARLRKWIFWILFGITLIYVLVVARTLTYFF